VVGVSRRGFLGRGFSVMGHGDIQIQGMRARDERRDERRESKDRYIEKGRGGRERTLTSCRNSRSKKGHNEGLELDVPSICN